MITRILAAVLSFTLCVGCNGSQTAHVRSNDAIAKPQGKVTGPALWATSVYGVARYSIDHFERRPSLVKCFMCEAALSTNGLLATIHDGYLEVRRLPERKPIVGAQMPNIPYQIVWGRTLYGLDRNGYVHRYDFRLRSSVLARVPTATGLVVGKDDSFAVTSPGVVTLYDARGSKRATFAASRDPHAALISLRNIFVSTRHNIVDHVVRRVTLDHIVLPDNDTISGLYLGNDGTLYILSNAGRACRDGAGKIYTFKQSNHRAVLRLSGLDQVKSVAEYRQKDLFVSVVPCGGIGPASAVGILVYRNASETPDLRLGDAAGSANMFVWPN